MTKIGQPHPGSALLSAVFEEARKNNSKIKPASAASAKKSDYANTRSSQGRDKQPSAVSAILHAVLARKGLDKKIGQYSFINDWHEIVGEELAKKTRPAKIRGNCLFITTISAVWAQELSFHKTVILQKLQQYLAEGQVINNVEFRVGEIK